MKGTPDVIVIRQKPHVREVVSMLKDHGATEIKVTQPKHYRIDMVVAGRRIHIGVPSTPTIKGAQVNYARQKLQRAMR